MVLDNYIHLRQLEPFARNTFNMSVAPLSTFYHNVVNTVQSRMKHADHRTAVGEE